MKSPVCGDGVVDQGEQCDNGNRVGCSSGCVPDAGYNCGATVGTASACGFCGNGIVEAGEECDNKNSVGCSANCKVDAGFECRGTNSNCYRKNPVCGNNVIEVGEACDDGNTVSGDGCSQFCFVEKDFSCSGQFGQSSKCQKSNTTPTQVCGNGVLEAGEQCDNGNQAGCNNCVIQSGYECANTQGAPSVCTPKVVIGNCGNGLFEPNAGEVCEDGNTANGDGCSSFCQVEFGWICVDNRVCVNLNDQRLKVFCGNGKVETQYGEVCDDGNNVDGDGCSGACQVESQWLCRILSYAENKSYCAKTTGLAYCGNGAVEGNETCDDGFPLNDGDGCSVSCQVEPGWNCQGGKCSRN